MLGPAVQWQAYYSRWTRALSAQDRHGSVLTAEPQHGVSANSAAGQCAVLHGTLGRQAPHSTASCAVLGLHQADSACCWDTYYAVCFLACLA